MSRRLWIIGGLAAVVVSLISVLPALAVFTYFTITEMHAIGDCVTDFGFTVTWDYGISADEQIGMAIYDSDGHVVTYLYPSLRTTDTVPWTYDASRGVPDPVVEAATSVPLIARLYQVGSGAVPISQFPTYPLLATFTFNPQDDGACMGLPLAGSVPGGPTPNAPLGFTDGRFNAFDAAAPVAIFPQTMPGGDGLVIYYDTGGLALVITPQEIAAVGDCPAVNTLIKWVEPYALQLWRLTSCEFQLMAPTRSSKVYVLIFTTPGAPYMSWEQDSW